MVWLLKSSICAKQSGTGALIEESKVPLHPLTEQTAIQFNLDPITCALHGGEDYNCCLR